MKKYTKGWLKFIIGWAICFAIRLIPFRPPNVEPILTTQMPFAKQYGWFWGFVFGFMSIFLFDLVTSGIGSWTLVTGVTYGVVGVGAYFFFKKRESKAFNYLAYGVPATIFYDAITGVLMGPILWHMSFTKAFMGQIPFTALHLAGNIAFSLLLSPAIYRWVVKNPSLEVDVLVRKFVKTTA